jgi:predicted nucleic acid-binding protein
MPMPAKAFCDTSFFYPCLDARDINHQAALAALEGAEGTILCTTWDVISETLTLLRYRSSYRQAMAFWTDLCPSLHVVRYGDRVWVEAVEVFRRYGRDHPLSFCDALSFIVVCTLLGQIPCLSFDRDFRRLGLSLMP